MKSKLFKDTVAAPANGTNQSCRLRLPVVQAKWQLRSAAMSGIVFFSLSLPFLTEQPRRHTHSLRSTKLNRRFPSSTRKPVVKWQG